MGEVPMKRNRVVSPIVNIPCLNEIVIPEDEVGGWRVEEEFVNAVRGLEPVRFTTFDDGLKYVEFAQAVLQSSRTGERVEIPFGLCV